MEAIHRFTDRVDDYVKCRPSYPLGVIELLKNSLGLTPHHIMADLGSGTGIFSRLLLSHGNLVFGVEPNFEMRARGELLLKDFTNFISIRGTAEDTTLAGSSVDLVTSAQAFHWFDPLKTRNECLRILRPHGKIALIWNERKKEGSPFLLGYESLLSKWSVDYKDVRRSDSELEETLKIFFGKKGFSKSTFENTQDFDFMSLSGRLLSSSYAPKEHHPYHQPLLSELKKLFNQCQNNGLIRFEYETRVYFGELED